MATPDHLESCEFEAGKLMVRLDLNLQADVQAIDPAVETVLRIAVEMKCAVGKAFEIETGLREALANAIRHGCGGDSAKLIRCCVACDESHGMLIIVSDPGQGFDPLSVPSPSWPSGSSPSTGAASTSSAS